MFIAALFLRAPNWKQPKCLSTGEDVKENVVCSYKGILLKIKRMNSWYLLQHGCTLNSCYMKGPDAKDYILYDSICMKFSEKANL